MMKINQNTTLTYYIKTMIGIYKITSPTNRVYIGQSINIDNRWDKYKSLSNCKRQPRLYRSFLKYGCINHIFEIIEQCDETNLNNKERFWQDYYDVIGKKGLNCILTTSDHSSGILSKETKRKQSISKIGTKQSASHIENRRLTRIGHKLTDCSKKNIGNGKRGKLISGKKVINVLTLEIYNSVSQMYHLTEYNYLTVVRKLNGRCKNNTNFKYL